MNWKLAYRVLLHGLPKCQECAQRDSNIDAMCTVSREQDGKRVIMYEPPNVMRLTTFARRRKAGR